METYGHNYMDIGVTEPDSSPQNHGTNLPTILIDSEALHAPFEVLCSPCDQSADVDPQESGHISRIWNLEKSLIHESTIFYAVSISQP